MLQERSGLLQEREAEQVLVQRGHIVQTFYVHS